MESWASRSAGASAGTSSIRPFGLRARRDGARVELVGARPDTFPHKPSKDIEDYLVDLRARSDSEVWLIVDQDAEEQGHAVKGVLGTQSEQADRRSVAVPSIGG